MSVGGWYTELSPRERKLIVGLSAVVGVMLLLLVPIGLDAMARSRREANNELREAIRRLQAAKGQVKARQQKRDEVAARYAKKAPKLAGFLEQVAKEQSIEIPESQDKPEIPIGKRYVERGILVRLRKVRGLPLLKFLEKIEQSGHPLAISRLSLRRRSGEKDSYDVELGVSAYDRNDVVPTAPTATAAGSGSSAPAGGGGR